MAETQEFDALIIGGGATGAGIARDCALRGLRVALIERHDIATGATGRNHGLLHSGARYAVTDGESARECINEKSYFCVASPATALNPPTGCLSLCLKMTWPGSKPLSTPVSRPVSMLKPLTPAEALRLEPAVNPTLLGAVQGTGRHRRSVPPDGRQYARRPRTRRADPYRLRGHRSAAPGRSCVRRTDLRSSTP